MRIRFGLYAAALACAALTTTSGGTRAAVQVLQLFGGNETGLSGDLDGSGTATIMLGPAAGNPGFSSGCVTGVSVAVINQLRATPTKFYVNVHSMTKPNGARPRAVVLAPRVLRDRNCSRRRAKLPFFVRDIAYRPC